ncbi:MAG: hypothetical protein IJR50_02965 [Treponema sp.]|nr:hypothetical protein [Treponema sp.]
MKLSKEYFVPLNIKKETWDVDKKLLFLDDYFERQLSDEEKKTFDYEILPITSFKHTKYEIDLFEAKLVNFFSDSLNKYHNVIFDFTFWKKLFLPWLDNFIYNTISKVEDLENLSTIYGDGIFFTACYSSEFNKKFLKEYGGLFYNEEYNNYVFCLIAKKYFNFKIKTENFKNYEVSNHNFGSDAPQIVKTSFFDKLKRITLKKILRKFLSAMNFFNNSLFNPELLLWCTYFSSDAYNYFFRKSHGKIRALNMHHVNMETELDIKFRQTLRESAEKYFFSDKLPIAQKIVTEIIFNFIPYYYIENFQKYLAAAQDFLNSHKSVKMFFATCTYCRETEPFLLTYAQTKGIKILTEQHGGNYGISCDVYNKEAFMNDALYAWGKWGNDVFDVSAKIYPASAYRQHDLYEGQKCGNDYILFVGSALSFYIACRDEYFSGHKGIHECIYSTEKFFTEISPEALSKILVRNYWLDYGYHLDADLISLFPKMKVQGYLQKNYNEDADFIARNASFSQTLLNCSLIITNEHETCFIEALYCEKPFIVLFNKYGFRLRPEEIPYFKMMEDVGVFFYDWNEAAKLVNKIHTDISSWWNNEKRQKVVKIIRERYSMKVPNLKKWWYQEFVRQLKLCGRGRNGK